MMTYTLEQLRRVGKELEGKDGEPYDICRRLVVTEIRRRERAGRPKTLNLSRKEQNRLSQKRRREFKHLRGLVKSNHPRKPQKAKNKSET